MEHDLNEFELSPEVREKLKNKKILQKELREGKTAQQILNFSDATMAKFYGAAYFLFEHKRYDDAAQAFLFLATLNPGNHEYWLGLGMAAQMMHNYDTAIDSYELSALCEIDNPVPYFYLAKCLFALHDRSNAIEALDLAIAAADERIEYATLKAQAQEAKRILLSHGI